MEDTIYSSSNSVASRERLFDADSDHATQPDSPRSAPKSNSVGREHDLPQWFGRYLPWLEKPQGRDSWCAGCRSIPEETLRRLETEVAKPISPEELTWTILDLTHRLDDTADDFATPFSAPSPECAFCNVLRSDGWYSLNLKNDYEKEGSLVTTCSRDQVDGDVKEGSLKITLFRQPQPGRKLPSRNPLGYLVRYPNLRATMQHCIDHHGSACNSTRQSAVKGLRLINCKTRLMEAGGEEKRYAALSYVWGTSEVASATPQGSIMPPMEPTVEDALRVTLEMGVEYLWVDRYCIDHESPHKNLQIGQMNLIFGDAHLTIIAATGDDPYHGLPGVSKCPRKGNPSCIIGDFVFFRDTHFSMELSFYEMVIGSTWNSRAWTFQEALLSRRCLVFTDFIAAFMCDETLQEEGLEDRAPTDVDEDETSEDEIDTRLYFRRNPDSPWGVKLLIEEYSTRKMTYPSDALSGLLGTLKACEEMNPPLFHYWGVPIIPFISGNKRCNTLPDSNPDGFIMGLSWYHCKPERRRSGFPSWSWAGWEGLVSFTGNSTAPTLDRVWDDQISDHVAVHMADGQILQWPEFEHLEYLKEHPFETLSPILDLESWTFEVVLEFANLRSQYQGVKAVLQGLDGDTYVRDVYLDDRSILEKAAMFDGKRFTCLLLGFG